MQENIPRFTGAKEREKWEATWKMWYTVFQE